MNDQEQKDITPTLEQLEQDMHKLLYGPDILTPIPKLEKTLTDEELTREIFS